MSNYIKKDLEYIYKIGQEVIGKTFYEIFGDQCFKFNNKGGIGNIVQSLLYNVPINSRSESDFIEEGVELKVIPFKEIKSNILVPKERMVLNLINYEKVVKESSFETSSFLNKNKVIQVIIYLHEYEKKWYDFKIINSFMIDITKQKEIETIKKDWLTIINYIKDGKADQLSERLTQILGACTKGKNKESKVKQPFSNIKAMSRAFSFKSSFIKYKVNEIKKNSIKYFNEIFIDNLREKNYTINYESIIGNIKKLIGVDLIKFTQDSKIKNWRNLAIKKYISFTYPNLLKDCETCNIKIIVKKLKYNGTIQEEIGTNYMLDINEMVEEKFIDSTFYQEVVLKKFIIIGIDCNNIVSKVFSFKFDESNIKNALKVYNDTKNKIIVALNKENKEMLRINFVKKSDNLTLHIRPKAINAKDTYKNGKYKLENQPKQCFWINKEELIEV
ncbi:hypothetical protein SCORR_v1c06820 [Spiroplasma corruscae]|uniref:DNA mismatch repair MutH/Type II restriction enzyme Sau3AI domain-containing protein n=1 Tax=Spiroplasma corruscae TaxID=216934 RepID=A0A222EQ96_9MOLU|nr:MutH/Sau3AI family endonuclease [Spiroplasma corruscae]ASP28454.1 hypothetical protein SCORR_v1c06820 [Spiroplasma corruscae]